MPLWHDEIAVLDVIGEIEGPFSGHVTERRRRDGGKVVAVVVGLGGYLRVGLILGDAVEVDGSVDEVDVIAGNADHALDQVEVLAVGFERGLEEDDDVAAAHIAVMNERRPVRGRRERDAIDHDVIADEQRLLHRGRRDGEILEDEGEGEEPEHEDAADGSEGFQWRFFTVLMGFARFLSGLLLERLLHCSCLNLLPPVSERCGGFDPTARSPLPC